MNAIPKSVLAHHTAIVGKTGSGKTSTEKLAVEQVYQEGFRVCVLDTTKSDWWGITSSASGKSAGLPFKILGGPRGHLPLHSSAGKALGQLIGSGKLPHSILDMADFEAGGIQRFFVDFAPALMRSAKGVLYLVIEEAHELAPKERAGFGSENMAIHWAKKLATAGRSKGIRLIVATQRVQALHNAVLGSCETVIAHRLTAPADQDPVLKWLKANSDKETEQAVAKTFSSLSTGEAWVCSGEARIFKRIKFKKFSTYDNTATPTGDDAQHHVTTAAVNLDELRSIIGDAVAEAEANDPKALKSQIAKLQAELSSARATPVRPASPEAIAAYERQGYERAVAGMKPSLAAIDVIMEKVQSKLADLVLEVREARSGLFATVPPPPTAAPRPMPAPAPITRPTPVESNSNLPKAERLVLTALAQYPRGRTKTQIAILTGYSSNGGGFNNALSKLRSNGFITGSATIQITQEGLQALGPFQPLPHGRALLDHWMRQLGKAERAILEQVTNAYPRSLTKAEIAAGAGYEPNGGGFNNAMSRLRTLELISGSGDIIANDALFG